MRLILAVLHTTDVDRLLREISELGVSATQIQGDTVVGRNGLAAVIVGVDDELVGDIVAVVHSAARGRSRRVDPLWPIAERAELWVPEPIEQRAGGASVFVLPVRHFERIGYA